VVAWVFFRAPDLNTAIVMLKGMAGLHGLQLPAEWAPHLGRVAPYLVKLGITFTALPSFSSGREVLWICVLFLVSTCMPNLRQLMAKYDLTLDAKESESNRGVLTLGQVELTWHPTFRWAALSVVALIISIALMTKVSPFLYFQF